MREVVKMPTHEEVKQLLPSSFLLWGRLIWRATMSYCMLLHFSFSHHTLGMSIYHSRFLFLSRPTNLSDTYVKDTCYELHFVLYTGCYELDRRLVP